MLSLLVRAAVFLVPISLSIVTATVTAHLVPRPHVLAWLVGWWALVLGVPTVVLMVTDRLARRALPLAVLLKMTMVFPDQAPKRFAVARRAGGTRDLARRVEEAKAHGNVDEPVVAAEKILSLAAALNAHDRLTRGHGERVRAFTDLIADELHLPAADRDRLRWAALLHDIGKIAVHTDILNKPEKLTDEEWEVIRKHPLEGAKLTAPLAGWLGAWANTIAEHHERYDGLGYPYGLAGDEISLGGRIVAVADSYDTMTALRTYRRPMSPQAARAELAACAGSQFDPQVVRAFLDVSIGRLRPVAGPLAWLGSLPFVDSIPQLGQVASAVGRAAAASAVIAGAVTAAALHHPGTHSVALAPPPSTTTTTTGPPAATTKTTTTTTSTTSTTTTTTTTIPAGRPPVDPGAPQPHSVTVVTSRRSDPPRPRPITKVKTPGERHGRPPSAGAPASLGTHNRGKGVTSFAITIDANLSSATTSYGSPAVLQESGLPADATGSITFVAASPARTLCTVSDYPAETSCTTPTGLGAGSYSGVAATFSDTDGAYDSSGSSNTVSLRLIPAVLTVTATSTSTPYGAAPVTTASYAGFENGEGPASLAAVPACSSSVAANTPVGSYPGANVCSGGAAGNYSFAYLAGAASVTPALLTVTAAATSTTYGTAPVVAAHYAGFQDGDGPGALAKAPVCASLVVATTAVGSYPGANNCSGGAAANYSFAYVAGDAAVNPAVLIVTASSTSTSYGAVPAVSPDYAGFVNGDGPASLTGAPACSSSVTAASAVGTYPSGNDCSGGEATNYSFAYFAGEAIVTPVVLTVTASATSTPYGAVPVVSPSYSGFVNGDDSGSLTSLPSCTSSVTATTPVGIYPEADTCSGGAATDYSFAYVAGAATVTEAALVVTASSTNTTYGTDPVVTASYAGFENGDGPGSLTSLPTCTSAVSNTSAVGSYVGANTCSGAVSSQYSIVYVSADATVTPAPLTVTASSTTTTYGTGPVVTATYSGFVNGDGPASLVTGPSCGSTVDASSAVGGYVGANACSGAAAMNYSFTYLAGNALVLPVSLTVTASTTSSTYGTVPAPSPSYSGFVNGDGPSSLTSLPTCSSAVTAASSVGGYSGANTCSGAAAVNYSFDYLAATASVTPATLTVTASSTSSSYGAAPLPSPSYSGFVNGDGIGALDAFATCTSSVTATTGVGSYPNANTCSGAAAENYVFSYAPGEATVVPALLTVTASSTSTPYGTVPVPSPSYSGFVNGDGPSSLTILPTCTSSVTATTPPGAYPGANTCSGAAGENYSFAYDAADATVLAAPLLSIVNGTGQPGRPDQGDQIIITFDPVPDLADMCNGNPDLYPAIDNPNVVVWGTGTLIGDDTLTVTDSADCAGGLNFGSIDLGQPGYFDLGTYSFGGPSPTCNGTDTSGCSSIAWNGSNTLTITLGAPEVGQPTQAIGSVAVYTPAPQLGLSGTISSADEENF